MKTKHLPVYRTLSRTLRREIPDLRRVTSASEASRILFGVKGLTKLITCGPDNHKALLAFFEGDPSGMVAWAQHGEFQASISPGAKYRYECDWLQFHAEPAHRKAYRALVKQFGLPFAVKATQERNFGDLCKGYAYLISDRKRKARFEKQIVSELSKWPVATRFHMIHDYAVAAEARAHRVVTPARSLDDIPVDMPQPALPATMAVGEDTYQILVPRHSADLRAIGRAQNHCVGTATMGYGDNVRAGEIYIVAIYRKALKDGICVEFDAGDLYIRQAQGRHRRSPTDAERVVIEAVQNELPAVG